MKTANRFLQLHDEFNTLHIMLMKADITMKYNKIIRHVLKNEM